MNFPKNDIDLVIYHGNPCTDGFGSALVVKTYYQQNNINHEIEFVGQSYSSDNIPDVKDKNVLICDFSFPSEITQKMIKESSSLLVIDHHKTAVENLKDIPEEYKIFDMNHSGAVLTWYYFFPDEEPPLFLRYIESRDLWRKDLPNTNAFIRWLGTLDYSFEVWKEYLDDDKLLSCIENLGIPYEEYNSFLVQDAAKHAKAVFSKIGNKYYFVAYVNSNNNKSDVGNKIFERLPYVDFSVTYSLNVHSANFSLRSTDSHVDVSQIAKTFGGGGHRNASGIHFNYPCSTLPCLTYDTGYLYGLLKNIYFQEFTLDGTKVNIVLLNSPICRREIGKYLLQEKFVKDGQSVQEAVFIRHLNEEKELEVMPIHISGIWYSDGESFDYHWTLADFFDSALSELSEKIISFF